MKRAQTAGGLMLLIFVAAAVFGPMLAAYAPFAVDGQRFSAPSAAHWLGTNALGQDIYSGLVHGARTTLLIGVAVAVLSTALSGGLGLLAGYSRRLDAVLNAVANMLLTLPSLLLVLIVASFTGGSAWQLILTLGLLTWPGYMRLIRASVLSLREREFVKAAQLYRGGTVYVLRKHLLPFLKPLLRTKFIISFKQAVAMEASLSFLGIGNPSQPSWGKMLQEAFARSETWMTDVWQWTVLPPALAILLVTVALALLGEKHETARSSAFQSARPRRPAKPAAAIPASNAHAAVAAQRLSVAYGAKTILHPLSLAAAKGSITAIVGESGSGKTTLYGLVPHKAVAGEAFIAGKPLYGPAPCGAMKRWADAAFIFQDPRSSFDPIMTIGAQMTEAIQGGGAARDKREAAARALREVQLDERLLGKYPHELSGGMLSRALIALALINKPAVLIADEPTGALDPIIKREIMDLLVSKVKEYKMTLLLVTHDLQAALHYADQMIVIEDGHLLEGADKARWLAGQGQPVSRTANGG
ncbi:Vitamin B12 import ATP-binding protein BtuD [Paenibacillus solanacearum]|uniref:Vitamin B12 import ATP-binding protein BtuD n=1 Tax=Paenibacillus solanacearum TaxID=2048548 RepID=A0A916NNX2_9BACL|nr:ABC transporter permease subunit [Paenibacillus solanacearum]CAG7615762.1 Vitamin B12 import ATP-binding protein BtuD [Paenibacillus solanacearum]